MPRFRNSNRQASEEMTYTAARRYRKQPASDRRVGYFQRIGFDFAMI